MGIPNLLYPNSPGLISQRPDSVRFATGHSPQITIGYWNDNFLFSEYFRRGTRQGSDDFITASFWGQYVHKTTTAPWIWDVFMNIVTTKPGGFRTDLLTLRFSRELLYDRYLFQIGVGILGRRNYGGEIIQNTYHRMFGYEKTILPYSGSPQTGILMFGKWESRILTGKYLSVAGYLSGSIRTGVTPGNVRGGLVLNSVNLSDSHIHLQGRMGYVKYFQIVNLLTPLFGDGFAWGALVAVHAYRQTKVELWITKNQYGMRQPHAGIGFTVGWDGLRQSDLGNITFP